MTIKTHGRMFTDNTVGITQIAVTDGSDGQALVTDGSGTLRFATVGAGGAVGSSVFVEDIRTGNGVLTTFTLSTAAPYEESIMVFIDGVAQPTSAYTLPSTTSITLSEAPATGTSIRIVHLGIASSVANNAITGAKISMGGDVAGDVLYYNGTDYQRLGIGTAGQHLATNTGATAPVWVTPTAGGVLVQRKVTRYATAGSGTAVIPHDNTRPGGTEGNEIFGVSFTPTNNNNNLLITARIYCDHDVDNEKYCILLTREVTGSNAPGASLSLSSNQGKHTGTAQYCELTFIEEGSIGTTAQTWTVRGACQSTGNTFYWNRHSFSATPFANIMSSWMIIDEYTP